MSDSGERPAFYALSPGGWRDYWTLLHPPYTLWHLSYVAIGAATATDVIRPRWLFETMLAFLLALGISAHALDELRGRPLRTRISDRVLWALAVVGVAGAVALGIDGMVQVSPWIGAFIAAGAFLVFAYNLELFGAAFHSDLWFALAWGAFPALTGAFAQTGRITVASAFVAFACAAISWAQRALSTPVRRLRRGVRRVSGEIELADGGTEPVDASSLRAAPEAALRALSISMPLLAAGLVIARWP